MSTQPHKHAAVINAFAEGKTIQRKYPRDGWLDVTRPGFKLDREYRVKPADDVIRYGAIARGAIANAPENLAEFVVTLDGETGAFKSVEAYTPAVASN